MRIPRNSRVEKRVAEDGYETWHLVFDGEEFPYPTALGSVKAKPVVSRRLDNNEPCILESCHWLQVTMFVNGPRPNIPDEYYETEQDDI